MAGRSEARIFASIWDDPQFCALNPGAQRLYLFLLSQRDLSYCGVISLRPRRWARKAQGLTVDEIEKDLQALAEPFGEGFQEGSGDGGGRAFLVVDEDTEEVFVRTLIRRDGIWKQPNLLKAAMEAATLIESPRILAEMLAELRRLPLHQSESKHVKKAAEDFIAQLEKALPNPSPDPSRNPSGDPSPDPSQGKGERGKGKDFLSVEGEGLSFSSDGDAADVPPELAQAIDRVCEHLAQRIIANGCKPPRITKKWRDAARLMMTVDGRTEQQIHAAIDWCQSDEFWRSNVLSMPKLREKYEQLRLQAAAKNRALARHQAPPTTSPRNRWMERE